YRDGTTFGDYMASVDPIFAETFALGYEALIDGILPRDLCLEQLPARFRRQGREFRCRYFALGQGEQFDGLLVVIDDITAQLLAARQEADRGEILALFESLTRDRDGLLTFIDEANEQVASLAAADFDTQKRLLHTLKGNANLVGFALVAGMCHALEEEIAETRGPLSPSSLEPLVGRWRELTKALQAFMGDKGREIVELRSRDVEQLADDIRGGISSSQILDRLASWRLEPAERPLARLGNHARALTARFGKGDLDVDIDGGGVRLSYKAWAGLWSDLVHLVRNAVDHGIESTTVRQQAGKPARPRLRLATSIVDHDLILEVEDDGAGIDWSAVRTIAARHGLPHATEEDLVRAIFSPDITTRTVATSISGRGIGLAAVRKQVDKLGGRVEVRSHRAAGTCFKFTFPLPEVGARVDIDARDRVVMAVTA
ncbi:MAG: sensor histidine kinase, partial [Pseudomonadota bacterium]